MWTTRLLRGVKLSDTSVDAEERLWISTLPWAGCANVATMTSPASAAMTLPERRLSITSASSSAGLTYTASTRVLWRSPSRLQLELGQRRIVIDGLSDRAADILSPGQVILDNLAPAREPEVDELLRHLHRLGFLSHVGSAAGTVDHQWCAKNVAFAPDVEALGERFGERSIDVMGRRQTRAVAVQGAGRLPAFIAGLLAAAGVGHVHVTGEDEVSLWDVMPGGLSLADEGRRTASAAAEAVARAAPDTNTRALSPAAADLIVLAGATPVGPSAQKMLLLDGTAHLSTSVWAASTVVGPLVIPGVTSCLGCADLHRQDRDPAWPALAVQLAAVKRVPSDVAVCALAAALTVTQALAYLDDEQPAVVDGTLEMSLPDWRIRRRSWFAHEQCVCRQRRQSSG